MIEPVAEGADYEGVVGMSLTLEEEVELLKETLTHKDIQLMTLEDDLQYMKEQYHQSALNMEAEILELRRRVKSEYKTALMHCQEQWSDKDTYDFHEWIMQF